MPESVRDEVLRRRAEREAGGVSPSRAHVDEARPDNTQEIPVRTRDRAQVDDWAGPLVAEVLSRIKSRRGGQLGAILEAKLSEAQIRAKDLPSPAVTYPGESPPPYPPPLPQLKPPNQERDDASGTRPRASAINSLELAERRDDSGVLHGVSRAYHRRRPVPWPELVPFGDGGSTPDGRPRRSPRSVWAELAEMEDTHDIRD